MAAERVSAAARGVSVWDVMKSVPGETVWLPCVRSRAVSCDFNICCSARLARSVSGGAGSGGSATEAARGGCGCPVLTGLRKSVPCLPDRSVSGVPDEERGSALACAVRPPVGAVALTGFEPGAGKTGLSGAADRLVAGNGAAPGTEMAGPPASTGATETTSPCNAALDATGSTGSAVSVFQFR